MYLEREREKSDLSVENVKDFFGWLITFYFVYVDAYASTHD